MIIYRDGQQLITSSYKAGPTQESGFLYNSTSTAHTSRADDGGMSYVTV